MLEITNDNFSRSFPIRFSKVLANEAGDRSGLQSDVVLYRDEKLIVCPTLGSFLPFWYLFIPQEHYLNFADWEAAGSDRSIFDRVQSWVHSVLGETSEYIWFEHGPANRGSITGCGVDHAHLHVILNTNFAAADVLQGAAELGVEGWVESDVAKVYDHRTSGGEYLAFGNSESGFLKNLDCPVGSQFFRRVLAHLDGRRSDWDYKKYDHQKNARRSVDRVLNSSINRGIPE